jgi:hypothetical protein
MSNAELVGAAKAAEIAGVHPKTIKRAAAQGTLPCALKLDGVTGPYLFDPADVAEWAARRAGVAA